ncbi:hypothetical protein M9H77_22331 [Catharanthus roseus]|uniref:Uncharacterized protein n=1 Tax=Catharanthus roseus TaxID=4058 RepID=A0ACC0AU77_CATRO|nr:hypothetical protein M9H77_22331 [Catharanthus roseus]
MVEASGRGQQGDMLEMQRIIEQLSRETPEGGRKIGNPPKGEFEDDIAELEEARNPFHDPVVHEQPEHGRLEERLTKVLDLNTREVRIEISDFHGKMHAENFFDWEASLENYFEWEPMDDNQKLLFVKMKLNGSAENSLVRTNNLNGRGGRFAASSTRNPSRTATRFTEIDRENNLAPYTANKSNPVKTRTTSSSRYFNCGKMGNGYNSCPARQTNLAEVDEEDVYHEENKINMMIKLRSRKWICCL